MVPGNRSSAPPPRVLFWLASLSGLDYLAAAEVLGRCVELGGHYVCWGWPHHQQHLTSLSRPAPHIHFRRARIASFACAAFVVRDWERFVGEWGASYAAQHRTSTDRQCCSHTAA